jgi:hypothetical protein
MYEYQGVAIVPLLIGLSELLKKIGINPKAIPIFNLVLGVFLGIVINRQDVVLGVVNGIAMSLMASGLYSGVKSSIENFKG